MLAVAGAAFAYERFPSFAFRLILTPVAPTSEAECAAMEAAFRKEIEQIGRNHEVCLQEAPKDAIGATPLVPADRRCSNPNCQGLHSARHEATELARERGHTCRARLAAHKERSREQLLKNAQTAMRASEAAQSQKQDTPVDAVVTGVSRFIETLPRERLATTWARERYARENPGKPNPYGTPQPLIPEDARLSDEQKKTLSDTGLALVWTKWSQLVITSVSDAIKRATGTVKTNPVADTAAPFLDAENAANIQLVIQTQRLTPHYTTNSPWQAKQLKRLDDEERREAERNQPKR